MKGILKVICVVATFCLVGCAHTPSMEEYYLPKPVGIGIPVKTPSGFVLYET